MALSEFVPPTDNLYKFLAITGLLIIEWTSAALYYFDNRVRDIAATSAAVANDSLVQIKIAREEADALSKLPPGDSLHQELKNRGNQDKSEAAKLALASASCADRVLTANQDYIGMLKICWLPFLVGGILVIVGFGLWFLFIQLREDRLIQLRIAEAELNVVRLRREMDFQEPERIWFGWLWRP